MKALLRLCKGDAEAVIFTVICLQYLQKVYRLLILLILEGTVIRYKNFENKKKQLTKMRFFYSNLKATTFYSENNEASRERADKQCTNFRCQRWAVCLLLSLKRCLLLGEKKPQLWICWIFPCMHDWKCMWWGVVFNLWQALQIFLFEIGL